MQQAISSSCQNKNPPKKSNSVPQQIEHWTRFLNDDDGFLIRISADTDHQREIFTWTLPKFIPAPFSFTPSFKECAFKVKSSEFICHKSDECEIIINK